MKNHSSDKVFLEKYESAISRARQIVLDHSIDGENSLFTISEMYPRGAQDIAFMIFHKITRIFGYMTIGNVGKVLDEAHDIINYAAFLIAYYETLPLKESNE